jgi:stage V sporulation protein AC
MQPTKEEYKTMVDKATPPGRHFSRFVWAFGVGGGICTLGQWLLNFYLGRGLEQEAAATMTSVTLIGLSALLTGLKVYDNIARLAGAGTLVPITGFSNAVTSPAMEFRTEGLVMGTGAKMFVIAGPVIVYGITASVVYGFIYFLLNMA